VGGIGIRRLLPPTYVMRSRALTAVDNELPFCADVGPWTPYEHVYSPNKAVRQTEGQIIYNRTTQ